MGQLSKDYPSGRCLLELTVGPALFILTPLTCPVRTLGYNESITTAIPEFLPIAASVGRKRESLPPGTADATYPKWNSTQEFSDGSLLKILINNIAETSFLVHMFQIFKINVLNNLKEETNCWNSHRMKILFPIYMEIFKNFHNLLFD